MHVPSIEGSAMIGLSAENATISRLAKLVVNDPRGEMRARDELNKQVAQHRAEKECHGALVERYQKEIKVSFLHTGGTLYNLFMHTTNRVAAGFTMELLFTPEIYRVRIVECVCAGI